MVVYITNGRFLIVKEVLTDAKAMDCGNFGF